MVEVEDVLALRREEADRGGESVEGWVAWNPSVAPHVAGRYEVRTFSEDGLPESQRVEAQCSKCAARMVIECASGAVRTHIARFAAHHLHRDPMGGKRE